MQKLTGLSKLLITAILVGSSVTAYRTYGGMLVATAEPTPPANSAKGPSSAGAPAAPIAVSALPAEKLAPLKDRPVRVALSQWPGHMALVVGAGGLKTQPGSIADPVGNRITFFEDEWPAAAG